MGRECSMHGIDEKCIVNFGGKLGRKRPHRRPKHGWEDNMMDCEEIGWKDEDQIKLAKNRVQWLACENKEISLLVP
jgi:hypothetical protein